MGINVPTYFPIILISWSFRLTYLIPASSRVQRIDSRREITTVIPLIITNHPGWNWLRGNKGKGWVAAPVITWRTVSSFVSNRSSIPIPWKGRKIQCLIGLMCSSRIFPVWRSFPLIFLTTKLQTDECTHSGRQRSKVSRKNRNSAL